MTVFWQPQCWDSTDLILCIHVSLLTRVYEELTPALKSPSSPHSVQWSSTRPVAPAPTLALIGVTLLTLSPVVSLRLLWLLSSSIQCIISSSQLHNPASNGNYKSTEGRVFHHFIVLLRN